MAWAAPSALEGGEPRYIPPAMYYPATEDEAPQAEIELAALPIEPGVESTGAIAIPSHNPVAVEIAEAGQADPVIYV